MLAAGLVLFQPRGFRYFKVREACYSNRGVCDQDRRRQNDGVAALRLFYVKHCCTSIFISAHEYYTEKRNVSWTCRSFGGQMLSS